MNRVQPIARPRPSPYAATTHPGRDRPRTGVITTTVTTAQTPAAPSAAVQACCWTAQATGSTPAATTVSCHPVKPKNQPIRARE